MARDLWPSTFGDIAVVPPVSILREQGSALATKTQGLVTAEVRSESSGHSFRYRFLLVAPALDSYTYELLAIRHGIELYPLEFISFPAGALEETTAVDEKAFLAALGMVFSFPGTKRVVAAMIAQSTK